MNRNTDMARLSAGLQKTVLIGSLVLLAGCSGGLPDWANPTEWFGGDDSDIYAQDVPDASSDRGYSGPPSLSTVPDRPEAISTPEERAASYSSLSDDGYDADDVYARPDRVANSRIGGAPSTFVSSNNLGPLAPDASLLPNMTGRPSAGSAQPTVNLGAVNLADLPGGTEPSFQPSTAAPLSDGVLAFLPNVVIGSGGVRSVALENSRSPEVQPFQTSVSTASNGSAPVETIFFANGSVYLNDQDRTRIDNAVRMQIADASRVLVVGHASTRSTARNAIEADAINFEISRRRAQAVAKVLVDRGVDPSLILIEARGTSDASNGPATEEQQAQSRRVEIYLN